MSRSRSWVHLLSATAVTLMFPVSVFAQVATLAATPVGTPVGAPGDGVVGEVRLIGTHILEDGLVVDDTLVGGFSGIDYDSTTGTWYMISDDMSEAAPARFYTATLDYSAESFDSVSIDSAVTLLQENGEPYPNADTGGNVADPESLRLDPRTGEIWYSSEGHAWLGTDPFIAVATAEGEFVRQLPMPEIFEIDEAEEIGPRTNSSIEGMTFSTDGETFWFSMESPLFQDSPEPTTETGAPVRITQIDRDGNVLGMYAYELEPFRNVPEGGQGSSGLSEIIAVDETTFLGVERLSVQDAEGVYSSYIRVYEFDISGATDISTMTSLDGQEYVPVSKRLVVDLNDVGVEPMDNIETISWGPELENGNRSLVLGSDNNFNPGDQVTIFVAFEVLD